ncbi:MAG: DUF2490 domain-containing protein [Bryobacter sp.]|jgi:hypothetical protein|nr:DUF2490 domain-containing protein [Bryobacter sp.]
MSNRYPEGVGYSLYVVRGLLLAALLSPAFAQSVATPIDKRSQWFTYSGDHPVSRRFAFHIDVGFRQMNVTPWQQYLVRPGVNYQLSKRFSLAAAYGYFQTNPEGLVLDRNSLPEHRFQQQITYSQPAGKLVLRHRFRVDERLLGSPLRPGQGRFWSLQNRLRYMARLDVPLVRDARERPVVYLAVYDEVFFRYQDAVRTHFDQNRLYGGIGYRPTRYEAIEVGVFNQRFQPTGIGRIENNFVLWVTFSSTAPLKQVFGRRTE